MLADRTPERQEAFRRSLDRLDQPATLDQTETDSLSALGPEEAQAFASSWSSLSGAQRAALVRLLRGVAEQNLRLDYGWLTRIALDDPDADVRVAGIEAMLDDESFVLLDRLLTLVGTDPVESVRRAAAEELSRFTLLAELESLHPSVSARLRDVLFRVVHDADEAAAVRSAAVAAIGYFSDPEALALAASAFGDADLRLGAVRAMGRGADSRWTDRLLPVLGSDDPAFRREAAKALAEIEDERAVGPLVDLVDDSEQDVRLAAIEALGTIGGETAREGLLYLLKDPDPVVREAADRAITGIEEEEAPAEEG